MYGVGNSNKKILKYEESKSHLILTTLINYAIVYSIYVAFLSAFNSFLGEEFVQNDFFMSKNGWILSGITLTILSIYSVFFSERSGFVTWGEKITGRKFIGIRKVWVNPYKKNRTFLFVVLMINIYIITNYFGGVPSVYNGIGYLRELLTWIIHIILLIKIGQGNISSVLVLVLINLASMMVTMFSKIEIGKGISIGVFIGFIVVYGITYFIYRENDEF